MISKEIKIPVDTSELDEAITKAEKLINLNAIACLDAVIFVRPKAAIRQFEVEEVVAKIKDELSNGILALPNAIELIIINKDGNVTVV